MKLHEDELTELKEQKPIKVWRAVEPGASDAGKSYSSGGQEYTVLSSEAVGRGDVLRRFGKSQYDKLREEFGARADYWLIVVVWGDHTDKLRLLAPIGGKSGDYTALPALAMSEEPEAVDAETLNRFAKAAKPAKEKLIVARKKKQRLRSARNLLKKTLDDA